MILKGSTHTGDVGIEIGKDYITISQCKKHKGARGERHECSGCVFLDKGQQKELKGILNTLNNLH